MTYEEINRPVVRNTVKEYYTGNETPSIREVI